jgi:hypothetical protein
MVCWSVYLLLRCMCYDFRCNFTTNVCMLFILKCVVSISYEFTHVKCLMRDYFAKYCWVKLSTLLVRICVCVRCLFLYVANSIIVAVILTAVSFVISLLDVGVGYRQVLYHVEILRCCRACNACSGFIRI